MGGQFISRIMLGTFVVSVVAFFLIGGNFIIARYHVYQEQQQAISNYIDKQADKVQKETSKRIDGNKTSTNLQEATLKVVAVIVIPKIKVVLPVFNDDSTEALNIGAGWQPASSQIGIGSHSNAVIVGHSGKKATFFTNLSKLDEQDPIYLKLKSGKILEYKVVSSK